MSPRQFTLLVERHTERVKREDRRAGGIIAMLYNVNRPEGAEGLDYYDFFPEWKEDISEQTDEEMYATMMMWTKAKALPS